MAQVVCLTSAAMKTKNPFRTRIAVRIACLALMVANAAASWAESRAPGEELAVWRAAAGVVAQDNLSRPYSVWYFQSDFTSASFIATALIDPDREKVCGLSEPEARELVSRLKAVSSEPMKLEKSVAKSAGFGI